LTFLHFRVQKPGAMLTSGFQDAKHRALVKMREAGHGPDAHRFGKHLDNLNGLVAVCADAGKRLHFAECRAATSAGIALH